MKKLAATICIVGTAVALSACSSTQTTSHSGAGYAHENTAGDMEGSAPVRTERVFKAAQTK